MNDFKKIGSGMLALLATSILLAGCTGGAHSAIPSSGSAVAGSSSSGTPAGATPSTSGGSTITLNNARQIQQLTGAQSVTAYVISGGNNSLVYYPVANCVNLPAAGTTGVTTTLQVPAPVGIDYVVLAASSGPCSTTASSNGLPAQVISAVQNASKTFTPPSNLTSSTLPVLGSVGTGPVTFTQTSGWTNPATVTAGGAAIPAGTSVALGYSVGVSSTLAASSASLSTTTSGLTTFEMDTSPMALQVNFTLQNSGASPLPNSVGNSNPPTTANVTDTPVTVTLVDSSTNAKAGNFAIGLLASNGTVLVGPSNDTFTITGGATCPSTAASTAQCATFQLGTVNNSLGNSATSGYPGVPPAGAVFFVSYKGTSQDQVNGSPAAVLTFSYQNQTVGTFNISAQTQVVTITPASNPFSASASGNLGAPLQVALSGVPATAGATASNGLVAAQGTNFYTSNGANATAFSTNTATWNAHTSAAAGTVLAAVAGGENTANTASSNIMFAADPNCSGGCTTTNSGIWTTTVANIAAGTAASQVTVATGQVSLNNNVGGGYAAGPIGLAFYSAGSANPPPSPGSTNGSLLVAVNNSVYRLDCGSATCTGSNTTILAGPGVAGGGTSQGCADGPGLTATFSFGTSKFVPMAINEDADLKNNNTSTAAAGNVLYVWDPGCAEIRTLTGLNGTTAGSATVSHLPVTGLSNVTGLSYDSANKLLYVSSGQQILAVSSTGTTATTFAGQTTPGTSNGLGLQAYPLQFNSGNVTTGTAGTSTTNGTVSTLYSGNISPSGASGLLANTNAETQAGTLGGISSYIATMSTPSGIVYDPNGTGNGGIFWWFDTGGSLPQLRAAF